MRIEQMLKSKCFCLFFPNHLNQKFYSYEVTVPFHIYCFFVVFFKPIFHSRLLVPVGPPGFLSLILQLLLALFPHHPPDLFRPTRDPTAQCLLYFSSC